MFTTTCAACRRRYYSAAPENLKWCDRCAQPLEPIDESAPLVDPLVVPLDHAEFLNAVPFHPKKLPFGPYRWH